MTGFGEAHRKDPVMAVAAEVRTINSRYFKLVIRSGEGYSALEPLMETLVRTHIKRGTIQVTLRVDRNRASDDFRLDTAVLSGYRQQLLDIDRLDTKYNDELASGNIISVVAVLEIHILMNAQVHKKPNTIRRLLCPPTMRINPSASR